MITWYRAVMFDHCDVPDAAVDQASLVCGPRPPVGQGCVGGGSWHDCQLGEGQALCQHRDRSCLSCSSMFNTKYSWYIAKYDVVHGQFVSCVVSLTCVSWFMISLPNVYMSWVSLWCSGELLWATGQIGRRCRCLQRHIGWWVSADICQLCQAPEACAVCKACCMQQGLWLAVRHSWSCVCFQVQEQPQCGDCGDDQDASSQSSPDAALGTVRECHAEGSRVSDRAIVSSIFRTWLAGIHRVNCL